MIWIKTEEENVTVTGFYLQIIGRAFDRLNQQVTYTSKLNDIKPRSGDTVVFCTLCQIFFAKGHKSDILGTGSLAGGIFHAAFR